MERSKPALAFVLTVILLSGVIFAYIIFSGDSGNYGPADNDGRNTATNPDNTSKAAEGYSDSPENLPGTAPDSEYPVEGGGLNSDGPVSDITKDRNLSNDHSAGEASTDRPGDSGEKSGTKDEARGNSKTVQKKIGNAGEIAIGGGPNGNCRITGRVVNANRLPVPSADVTLSVSYSIGNHPRQTFQGMRAYNTVSDAEGRFAFDNVPADGVAFCEISHDDFAPGTSAKVQTKAETETSLGDIVLSTGATLIGYVRDESGVPIAGASYSIVLRDGPKWGNTFYIAGAAEENTPKTDSFGYFEVSHVPQGKFEVRAQCSGFAKGEFPIIEVVEERVYSGLEIVLRRAYSLAGRVQDEDGKPLKDVHISAYTRPENDSPTSASAKTDAEGRFVLDGLIGEIAYLNANKRDYGNIRNYEVSLLTDEVVLVLKRPLKGRVSAIVVNATTGNAVSDFTVSARPDYRTREGTTRYYGTSTRGNFRNGKFNIELVAGTYTLVIRASALVEKQIDNVTVREGQETGLGQIALTSGAIVTGRVLDIAGNPAIGAKVSVFGQRFRRSTTDADGNFRISGLATGNVELQASHADFAPSAKTNLSVTEGSVAGNILLYLSSGGTVEGRIYDSEGNPTDGGIRIWNEDYSAIAYSGSEGKYKIEHVPPGRYSAAYYSRTHGLIYRSLGINARVTRTVISIDSGTPRDSEIDGREAVVLDGQVTYFDLHLPPVCRLAGYVYADGELAPGTTLRFKELSSGDNQVFAKQVTVDIEGKYSTDIKPGKYTVYAYADSKQTGSAEIEVPTGPEAVVDITIVKPEPAEQNNENSGEDIPEKR